MHPTAIGRRLILRCRLCTVTPDGLFIEPTDTRALYAACDHALDHHRDALLTDPEATLGMVSVVA